jgi:hypothetical protein
VRGQKSERRRMRKSGRFLPDKRRGLATVMHGNHKVTSGWRCLDQEVLGPVRKSTPTLALPMHRLDLTAMTYA